jgi:uncharacterized membrane protein YgcG
VCGVELAGGLFEAADRLFEATPATLDEPPARAGVLLWWVSGVLVVALALGAVVDCVVVVTSADVVTVRVVVGAAFDESAASFTSDAANTPTDSAISTAAVVVRPFQLGAAASRVRAAAPQFRHHSWSGCSGARHRGQPSPAGGGLGCGGLCCGGLATLTLLSPAGG